MTFVLLAVLVFLVGRVHFVYGGDVGFKACGKDGWSLSDTFVDLDDYIGKSLLANIDKAKVLRALFACKVITHPAVNRRD
ncbi:MAG: hypothetical protein AB7O24_04360 [Kofleriaceae bacterium]